MLLATGHLTWTLSLKYKSARISVTHWEPIDVLEAVQTCSTACLDLYSSVYQHVFGQNQQRIDHSSGSSCLCGLKQSLMKSYELDRYAWSGCTAWDGVPGDIYQDCIPRFCWYSSANSSPFDSKQSWMKSHKLCRCPWKTCVAFFRVPGSLYHHPHLCVCFCAFANALVLVSYIYDLAWPTDQT